VGVLEQNNYKGYSLRTSPGDVCDKEWVGMSRCLPSTAYSLLSIAELGNQRLSAVFLGQTVPSFKWVCGNVTSSGFFQ